MGGNLGGVGFGVVECVGLNVGWRVGLGVGLGEGEPAVDVVGLGTVGLGAVGLGAVGLGVVGVGVGCGTRGVTNGSGGA